MTVTGQKLAVDPSHGRTAIDVFNKQLNERIRAVSTSRPFVVFVVITAIVLGAYYFVMAAPIYTSQASFAIRGREEPSAASSLLATLGGGIGSSAAPSTTDIADLDTYINSYEMASKLDQEFHLRQLYSHPRLDFLNWLPRNASRDDFLAFYRKMVRVTVDHDANLINLKVRSFDPHTAQAMNAEILRLSADYLNNLSAIVRRDTLRTSERELQQAEDKVRQARMAMTNYRAATGTLDPAASAIATSTGISAMQQEVLEMRAELASELSYNRPGSPAVLQTQARINGLQEQIAAQQKKIADTKSSTSIAERLKIYEGLQIASDYADRQLVAALAAYDGARSIAGERERFIVPAVPPNLPDEPSEPHRLSGFLEALLVMIAVYGIVALAIAGVRDHQGI